MAELVSNEAERLLGERAEGEQEPEEAPAAEAAATRVAQAAAAQASATNSLVVDFRYMLRARNHLLWVVTTEERRAERIIAAAAVAEKYKVRYWDCATGATDIEGQKVQIPSPEVLPSSVYAKVREGSERALWILRDLHDWMADPTTTRGLKSLTRELQEVVDKSKRSVVVVLSPSPEVPLTLRNSAVVVDWPLPARAEVGSILDDVLATSGKSINGERDKVVDAAIGLTADDMAAAFARSLVRHKRIDPAVVAAEKKRIVDRERVLTWFEPDPRGLEGVGGLPDLRAWLEERRLALTPEAREFGLPAPKGVLIVGIPGCGKSLTAKAVPTAWGGLPLVRMDMGALRSKYVGESEANLRKALKLAEAVAPMVLWLDEIEKGLAGSDGRNDGGVSADALGAILTWLQERQGEVFVVATANNVESLPPELSRKGRFDEVFFVDLPTRDERWSILEITLRQYKRDPEGFNCRAVANATREFSGAEVAELVPTALFSAFAGKRALQTQDLLAAAATVVPMSRSSSERIAALREWAKTRARRASPPESDGRTPGRIGGIEIDHSTFEDEEIK